MPTIADQLQELLNQKKALVDNLKTKKIDADYDEKLNTLVPKILDINGSGKTISMIDATATSDDLLKDKVAYTTYGGTTEPTRIAGTITIQDEKEVKTYIPKKTSQTIPKGYYRNDITIVGDNNLVQENIKTGTSIFGVNGTFTSDGDATSADILKDKIAYVDGKKVVGSIPSLKTETFRPDKDGKTYEAGNYIAGDIIIEGDDNLTAENIKAGETIFGIVGSYTGADMTNTTAVASDILYGKTAYTQDGLITGIVEPISDEDLDIKPGSEKVTITGPKFLEEGKSITVSGIVVKASDIRYGATVAGTSGTFTEISSNAAEEAQVMLGKIFYVNGEEKEGTMETVNGTELTPSNTNFVYTDEQCYLNGKYFIRSEPNMISSNIKTGVSIYGVEGSYSEISDGEVAAKANEIAYGKTAFVNGEKLTGTAVYATKFDYYTSSSDQSVTGPLYLETNKKITFHKPVIDASIVKYSESLYGVSGTYTSDATAVAADIMSGEIAYVKGEKITGSYVPLDTSDATAVAADIMSGKTAYVNGVQVTGTYTPLDTSGDATSADILKDKTAYVNGVQVTGTIESMAAAKIYSTTKDNTLNTKGKYMTGNIVIGGDSNLLAENIKNGVEILNVTGTFTYESESPATAADITKGKIAYVNGEKLTGTYESTTIDVSDTTVNESNLLEGIIAVGKDSSGKPIKITGKYKASTSSESFAPEASYTPSTKDITLSTTNKLVTGDIIIKGDSNLLASNIKKDVEIFGIKGIYGESGYKETVMFSVGTTDAVDTIMTNYGSKIYIYGDIDEDGTYSSELLHQKNSDDSYRYKFTYSQSAKYYLSVFYDETSNGIPSGLNMTINSSSFTKNYAIFTDKISITGSKILLGLQLYAAYYDAPYLIFSLYSSTDINTLTTALTNDTSPVYTKNIRIQTDSDGLLLTTTSKKFKYFVELADIPTGEYYLAISATNSSVNNLFILNYLSIINM